MNKKLKLPPKRKNDLTPLTELAKKLEKLIGKDFILTGKSRTDGSNLRKLIAQTLFDNNKLHSLLLVALYRQGFQKYFLGFLKI